jgi:hypothetical protein
MLISDMDAWTVAHDHGWSDGPENEIKRETNPAATVVVIDITKQR